MKDLGNATAISKMADDQTEGMDRRVLWASLYGKNAPEIGGGQEKLTLRYVFDDTAKQLVSAATRFLHGRKVVPSEQLRPEAIMDQVAKEVLKARGLSAPIGFVGEQPDSAYQ
jgi:NitT/TauT family transport system substrate-binding protein